MNCTEKGYPYDCFGYMIPTEAQWEVAARSGTSKSFWTGLGDDFGGEAAPPDSCGGEAIITDGVHTNLGTLAWYCATQEEPLGVKDVAQKSPNGFGLFDVHGNVGEWTSDWWGCSQEVLNRGSWCSSGTMRNLKGACWYAEPSHMRVTERTFGAMLLQDNYVGFRISISIP